MTTAALGVHTHPALKLGRRPAKGAPALRLADHLAAVPAHPVADPAPALVWPMDRNDQAGDCVVAGLDHALQAIYASLGVPRANWSDAELLAYYQSQNPGFTSWGDAGGPDDQGMDIQTFLEHLVRAGVILGFAKVNPQDEDEVKAAVYLGLAIVTGENLQQAQQGQTVWDVVDGSPDWGGHATCWVGYQGFPDVDQMVTWGRVLAMTPRFAAERVEEAWFIVTQAHVDHPAFRAGFDLTSFAQAYTQITGRPFPAAVPPSPTPAPTPPPAPVPSKASAEDQALWRMAGRWANGHHHIGEAGKVASAMRAWAASLGMANPGREAGAA